MKKQILAPAIQEERRETERSSPTKTQRKIVNQGACQEVFPLENKRKGN